MSETRAAKILVWQSELAERLGLPAGTTVHRIEIEGDRMEPILALVVSGEDYPRYLNGAVLYRTCEPLVECGYMVRGRLINQETSPLQMYHVTDDGVRAAGVMNRFRREDRLGK